LKSTIEILEPLSHRSLDDLEAECELLKNFEKKLNYSNAKRRRFSTLKAPRLNEMREELLAWRFDAGLR
jgi:hypothetical protein